AARWRVGWIPAAAVTSVLALAGLPIMLFDFDNMVAAGFYENAMQAVVQGALAGAGAIYFFTRSVVYLGASRAVLFPSLVPPFTLLIGYFTIGEAPSVSQLIGLVIVLAGFGLTQRAWGSWAALREVRTSPMRASACNMFSVELA